MRYNNALISQSVEFQVTRAWHVRRKIEFTKKSNTPYYCINIRNLISRLKSMLWQLQLISKFFRLLRPLILQVDFTHNFFLNLKSKIWICQFRNVIWRLVIHLFVLIFSALKVSVSVVNASSSGHTANVQVCISDLKSILL